MCLLSSDTCLSWPGYLSINLAIILCQIIFVVVVCHRLHLLFRSFNLSKHIYFTILFFQFPLHVNDAILIFSHFPKELAFFFMNRFPPHNTHTLCYTGSTYEIKHNFNLTPRCNPVRNFQMPRITQRKCIMWEKAIDSSVVN